MPRRPKTLKYKKDDLVGIFHDAMYVFRVDHFNEETCAYVCECVNSYTDTIKVGELAEFKQSRLKIKLGENNNQFNLVNK